MNGPEVKVPDTDITYAEAAAFATRDLAIEYQVHWLEIYLQIIAGHP